MKQTRATPRAKMDFLAMQDGIIERAKQNLMQDGYLSPVLFIRTDEEETVVVGMKHWSREQFPAVLKALVDRFHGKAVMLLTEAWVAMKPRGAPTKLLESLPEDYRPSKDPERTEAIIFYWAERNGRMGVRLISFRRDPWRFDEMKVDMAALGEMFSEAFAHLWPEEIAGHA